MLACAFLIGRILIVLVSAALYSATRILWQALCFKALDSENFDLQKTFRDAVQQRHSLTMKVQ